MIDLIKDAKVWTRNQIRKRTEAYIQQHQTHGDELILNRINDAALLGLRPATVGEQQWRDQQYLPRAVAAGMLAEQMAADNGVLAALVNIQQSLVDYHRLGALLDEGSIREFVTDENGTLIDNPAYLSVVELHAASLAVMEAATNTEWQLVAQRIAGAAIADDAELHAAVVRILPTIGLLNGYVESATALTVDARFTLETERERILAELLPVEEPADSANTVLEPDA